MGKRTMVKEGQPQFRHWGSSLSLESDDPGLGEITRRTLRGVPSPPLCTSAAVPALPLGMLKHFCIFNVSTSAVVVIS